MKKPDYGKKAVVLRLGLDRVESRMSWLKYKSDNAFIADFDTGEIVKDGFVITDQDRKEWETCYGFKSLFFREVDFADDFWQEAHKVNHATFERVKRLRNRVATILGKDAVFLTLTFTDEVLKNTSEKTRRKYVQRFLKRSGGLYVGNLDYGKQNGREHYHALIQAEGVDYALWHQYGAIKGEKVRLSHDNGEVDARHEKRLAKYIAKLSNHAIKETTKRSVLLYSR